MAVVLGLTLAPMLAGCGQDASKSSGSAAATRTGADTAVTKAAATPAASSSASASASAVQPVDLATANLMCTWHQEGMLSTYYWTTDGTKTLEKQGSMAGAKPMRVIAVTEGTIQHEVSVDDDRKIWSLEDTDTTNAPATGPYPAATLVRMAMATLQRLVDIAANPSLDPNATVVREDLEGQPAIHVTVPLPAPQPDQPAYADYLSYFTPTEVWLDPNTSLPIQATGKDIRYTADDPQNDEQYRYYAWQPRTAQTDAMFSTEMPGDYRQVSSQEFSDEVSSGHGQ